VTARQVIVTVLRHADRHAGPDRDFAECWELTVPAGPLPDVLLEVAVNVEHLPAEGRYTVTIAEPHDPEPS